MASTTALAKAAARESSWERRVGMGRGLACGGALRHENSALSTMVRSRMIGPGLQRNCFATSTTCSAVIPSSFMTSDARRRQAETIDSDRHAVEADVARPRRRHRGLDGDATPARAGARLRSGTPAGWRSKRAKHGMLTTRVPGPSASAAFSACCSSLPGRHQDEIERSGLFPCDVAALEDAFAARLDGDVLRGAARPGA